MRARALALLWLLLAGCAMAAGQTAGPTPAPTATLEARGAALFRNRGCGTCHVHGAAGNAGSSIGAGPALSAYRGDEAFLRAWLRNPAAVRPGTAMPTIGLAEDEIDALVAFLVP